VRHVLVDEITPDANDVVRVTQDRTGSWYVASAGEKGATGPFPDRATALAAARESAAETGAAVVADGITTPAPAPVPLPRNAKTPLGTAA
jgi:uncharacterized protein DUF2188